MVKKAVLLLMVLSFMVMPTKGYAYFESSSWTESDSYLGKTGGKLVFGVKNIVFGLGDVFYEPHRFEEKGNSATLGLLKGIIDAPVNIIGGIIHLVTFPIPLDVPLPDGGVELEEFEDAPSPESYKINQYEKSQGA